MKNVVYLIPFDGIGGVEIAAATLQKYRNRFMNINVQYIFSHKKDLFNIVKLLQSVKRVVELKPDLLIVSLWRSVLVAIFIKIYMPKLKVILFVHSEKDTHIFDFLTTRLMVFMCHEVWCDSSASLSNRFPVLRPKTPAKIISFNSRRISRLPERKLAPNFVYWGRISKDKGVYRALDIFKKLLVFFPAATYKLIGDCSEEGIEIKQYCVDVGLMGSVQFYKETDLEGLLHHARLASFYLQASKFEGMAMSVMEAMMMGLVPVVTPVGEIQKYCNKNNSILIHSNLEAVRSIMQILKNESSFLCASNAAVLTWEGQMYYVDSVSSNCERVLKEEINK
jgi:glycosyltransferase involved in cell wall biosynthesis